MRYSKELGLWVPEYSRNLCNIAPGLMPIVGGELLPPLTGLLLWNRAPIDGAINNDVITDWLATAPTTLDWHQTGIGGPTYKTNGINGKPALLFIESGGIGDAMDLAGESLVAYQALTSASMYLVGQTDEDHPHAAGDVNGPYELSDVTSTGHTTLPGATGLAQESAFSTTHHALGDLSQSFAAPFIYGVLSEANNYKVRMNGIQVYTTGTNTFETKSAGTPFIGTIDTAGGDFYWKGYMGEILIYDHVLDAAEITQLERYLSRRWAITVPYVAPATPVMTGLYLWLDAGTLSLSDSDPVDTWADQSGNGFDFAGSGTARPLYRNSAVTINGLPVVQFDGSNDELINNALDTDGWSSATVIAVGRVDNDPPGNIAQSGLWDFNTSNLTTSVPFTDSAAYDGTFTSARKSTGNPSPSLASPFVLTVSSTASYYALRFNGKFHYHNATNTFQGRNTGTDCKIGKSSTANATAFYDGVFAEILVYEGILSDKDRDAVENYLKAKYGIT